MCCPRCGFENPEGMKCCGACAAPLRSRRPTCGFGNRPRFKGSGECATRLQPPSPAATAPVIAALSAAPSVHEDSPCWGDARHAQQPLLKGRVT
jgi:hypothetical protein